MSEKRYFRWQNRLNRAYLSPLLLPVVFWALYSFVYSFLLIYLATSRKKKCKPDNEKSTQNGSGRHEPLSQFFISKNKCYEPKRCVPLFFSYPLRLWPCAFGRQLAFMLVALFPSATPCWRDPFGSKQVSTVVSWLSVWTLSRLCRVNVWRCSTYRTRFDCSKISLSYFVFCFYFGLNHTNEITLKCGPEPGQHQFRLRSL